LLKTNVNERFFQQEVIIMIKLFLSIIFNGFPVLSFPVCIVQIFRSPEKRWIEVSLYITQNMCTKIACAKDVSGILPFMVFV
jgi:hypothetical protein